MNPLAGKGTGFAYIEIMVALLLLAVCAVPAARAIRGSATAVAVASAKARELRCMKSHMELVLAEPFERLAAAVTYDGAPSSYSLAADTSCMARYVMIVRYERKYQGPEKVLTLANSTDAERDAAMLRISVTALDPRSGPVKDDEGAYTYTFTTLVIR
ncbi:MAG TPA: hypothetical protein VF861_15290 [Telluria sp.]